MALEGLVLGSLTLYLKGMRNFDVPTFWLLLYGQHVQDVTHQTLQVLKGAGSLDHFTHWFYTADDINPALPYWP